MSDSHKGLNDAARAAHEAREKASMSTDPFDHAKANALDAVVDAEIRAIRDEGREEPDLTGIPTPEEAGYVSEIRIEKPGVEN
jgi:hypothetical protein